jgi:hypothetical protein
MNNNFRPSSIQNTDLFSKSRELPQKALSVIESSIEDDCVMDISKEYKIDDEGYSYRYILKDDINQIMLRRASSHIINSSSDPYFQA